MLRCIVISGGYFAGTNVLSVLISLLAGAKQIPPGDLGHRSSTMDTNSGIDLSG